MQNLKEIDIRQLGSTHYERGAASSFRDGDFGVHNIIDNGSDDDVPGKCDRKLRVTMIDGRGTGYGRANTDVGGFVRLVGASRNCNSAE